MHCLISYQDSEDRLHLRSQEPEVHWRHNVGEDIARLVRDARRIDPSATFELEAGAEPFRERLFG